MDKLINDKLIKLLKYLVAGGTAATAINITRLLNFIVNFDSVGVGAFNATSLFA